MSTRSDRDFLSHILTRSPTKWAKRIVDWDFNLYRGIEVEQTTLSTTATRITTPNYSGDFFLVCKTGDIYIGDIDVTVSTGYLLAQDEKMNLKNFKRKNNNELYGITASGSLVVFAVGRST